MCFREYYLKYISIIWVLSQEKVDTNLSEKKCIFKVFSGILLEKHDYQLVLMHRTGMWKIKWKSHDFVVFSGIFLKIHQSSVSLYHGKGMRNLSKFKCILRCYREYYWKVWVFY